METMFLSFLSCIARIARPQMTVAGLAWFAIVTSAVTAGEPEPPEPLLAQLVFRIQDPGPDSPVVKEFRYRFTIYSAAADDAVERDSVLCQTEEGLLRIPEPFPPYGRLHVWIEANDPERGYRHRFESFSYRINPDAATETPAIQLEQGIVLSGTVVDAKTGKPLAGAEVAPLKRGHHDSWADWDESTRTDHAGRFRIGTCEAQGIAVRHAGYRDADLDHRPWGFNAGTNNLEMPQYEAEDNAARSRKFPELHSDGFRLQLHPLMTLYGRVVDPDGAPIADVWVNQDRSDSQGRFQVGVTAEEWRERGKRDVWLYADGFQSIHVPLTQFSFDRETVVSLKKETFIEGQVLDEHDTPVEDCTIEIKSQTLSTDVLPMISDFAVARGPLKQGKWQYPAEENADVYTLRVSVAGVVRSMSEHTRAEALNVPIITRLGKGRKIRGQLVANVPLNDTNTPVVSLLTVDNDNLQQHAVIQPNGDFLFSCLSDGKYMLQVRPAMPALSRSDDGMSGVDIYFFPGFDPPCKPLTIPITIKGEDVTLEPIDLHASGLLPGKVKGIVYHPNATGTPYANAFGYLCPSSRAYDTVRSEYYFLRVMTDADGRFQIDRCPPGNYTLRFRGPPSSPHDATVWVHVQSEQTNDLQLFGPDQTGQLPIRFVCGDGSHTDVCAAVGLDPKVIAKYYDPKTHDLPFIEDDRDRARATPSEIQCCLAPMDEHLTHGPVPGKGFPLTPDAFSGDRSSHVVIANLSPGRWRLTLKTVYSSARGCYNAALPIHDFTFSKDMAPLQIQLPPAALAGTIKDYTMPAPSMFSYSLVKAIPKRSDLPTRTCRYAGVFRFVALAPGTYSVRFETPGHEVRQIDNVIVREGETTWLEDVVLQETPPQPAAPSSAISPPIMSQ